MPRRGGDPLRPAPGHRRPAGSGRPTRAHPNGVPRTRRPHRRRVLRLTDHHRVGGRQAHTPATWPLAQRGGARGYPVTGAAGAPACRCRLPSAPGTHWPCAALVLTNAARQLASWPCAVAFGWNDSWATWPTAAQPPLTKTLGSTVSRRCHSGPAEVHASCPSVALDRSRKRAFTRSATARRVEDSCGTADCRPQRASSDRYGQPTNPCVRTMFSVTVDE